MTVDFFAGEIRFFAGNFAPENWLICNGSSLARQTNPELFSVIGYSFGGSGPQFNLPNLQGRVPIGVGTGPGLSEYQLGQQGGGFGSILHPENLASHHHSFSGTLVVGGKPHSGKPANSFLGSPTMTNIFNENIGHGTMANDMVRGRTDPFGYGVPQSFGIMQPYLPLLPVIAKKTDSTLGFIGEVRMFGGSQPPNGWSVCDGKTLDIVENELLFSLLGTAYGGDGVNNFALPDLRGRVPVGVNETNAALPMVQRAQKDGTEQQVMKVENYPAHQHKALPDTTLYFGNEATSPSPGGNYFGWTDNTPFLAYTDTANIKMADNSVQGATDYFGQDKPVPIVQPYTGVNYIINLTGTYPQRG